MTAREVKQLMARIEETLMPLNNLLAQYQEEENVDLLATKPDWVLSEVAGCLALTTFQLHELEKQSDKLLFGGGVG